MMKKLRIATVLLSSTIALTGCPDKPQPDQQKAKGQHVWKAQTDTIEKAKAVEDILQNSAQQRFQQIDQTAQE